jgi:hypothetical protein
MKLLTVLAASAAAAAVAAALSLPAGADSGPRARKVSITVSGGSSGVKNSADLASCLQAHGATGLPDVRDPMAMKQWMIAHQDDAAVKACTPGPDELLTCLKSKGLNPPTSLTDLKPWMLQQMQTAAGKAVLQACGVNPDPPQDDKTPADVAACLTSHGATGVPDGSDGVALKQWIGAHASDPGLADAIKACLGGPPGGDKPAGDPKADCGGGTAEPAPAKPEPSATPDAASTQ